MTSETIAENKTSAIDSLKSLATLDFLFFRNESAGTIIDYPSGRSSRNKQNDNGATYGIIASAGDTGVTSGSIDLLDILFSKTNTVEDATDKNADDVVYGKTYVGSADYLFQYNANTGYYFYDSALNAAAYNQSESRFYVYDYVTAVNSGGSTSDFMPYNYVPYASSYSYYLDNSISSSYVSNYKVATNYTNYWFGMSTELTFYLPDDVGAANCQNLDITGNYDMTFKFSGDDDVWIFVDDVLVLDLGGIHDIVYGEIDFTTGEVLIVNNKDDITYNDRHIIDYKDGATTSPQSAATTYIQSLKSGSHTLKLYYLERGSGQLNSAVYTNVSSAYYNLSLSKVDESTGDSLDGAKFTFYSDNTFEDDKKVLLENASGEETSTFAAGETAYGLQQGTLYYVLETELPEGYTAEGKYFTVLLGKSTLTVTVYNSSGNALETYTYTINYDAGSGYTYSCASPVTNTESWNYLYKKDGGEYVTIKETISGGTVAYYDVSFILANTKAYEMPDTGSVGGLFYRNIGGAFVLLSIIGLLITALYRLVWIRKFRMGVNIKEHAKEKPWCNKHRAKTRDHPQERNMIYGRDAPEVFANEMKSSVHDTAISPQGNALRSRGTGPGS